MAGEKDIGLDMDNLDYHIRKPALSKYPISKAGNYLHGAEYARWHRADGVVSVSVNPGNLASDLYRDQPFLFRLASKSFTYPSLFGAYTELFAGVSQDINLNESGGWSTIHDGNFVYMCQLTWCEVVPFGRIYPIQKDLVAAAKPEDEGGNGEGAKFWEWTEEQVKAYI